MKRKLIIDFIKDNAKPPTGRIFLQIAYLKKDGYPTYNL